VNSDRGLYPKVQLSARWTMETTDLQAYVTGLLIGALDRAREEGAPIQVTTMEAPDALWSPSFAVADLATGSWVLVSVDRGW